MLGNSITDIFQVPTHHQATVKSAFIHQGKYRWYSPWREVAVSMTPPFGSVLSSCRRGPPWNEICLFNLSIFMSHQLERCIGSDQGKVHSLCSAVLCVGSWEGVDNRSVFWLLLSRAVPLTFLHPSEELRVDKILGGDTTRPADPS